MMKFLCLAFACAVISSGVLTAQQPEYVDFTFNDSFQIPIEPEPPFDLLTHGAWCRKLCGSNEFLPDDGFLITGKYYVPCPEFAPAFVFLSVNGSEPFYLDPSMMESFEYDNHDTPGIGLHKRLTASVRIPNDPSLQGQSFDVSMHAAAVHLLPGGGEPSTVGIAEPLSFQLNF